ncbi:MAG: peptidyl-tRNA hydrolase [Parcubacteria group bacterium Gr01-1014_33]|nr:MAG: peptidyl-tRNA hydrolase [Parcubacteria group bacterium Gr01-1014_33]
MQKSMKTILIAGLGNPGKECISTRHNIGREIVEAFRKKMDMPEFRFEKKWNAQISEGKIGKVKIALLLPDTMMNNSGKALAPVMRFFKIKPADINLVHDDADIALGKCKLSFGKNAAGHKGVESVIRALKTNEFWRFRIGIAGKRDIPAEKLVLKKWAHDEMRIVKKIIAKTTDAIKETITEGPEKAMNEYNK